MTEDSKNSEITSTKSDSMPADFESKHATEKSYDKNNYSGINDNILIHYDALFKDFYKKYDKLNSQIEASNSNLENSNLRLNRFRDELRSQNTRTIEVIGVFSAVLALIIIDVNIIKSAQNFTELISLIIALNASIAIFIGLISAMFAKEENSFFKNASFWSGIIILIILMLVGIYFNVDIK